MQKYTSIVTCPCGSEFRARDADIKRGRGKYCSQHCAGKYQIRVPKEPNQKCANCGKQFYRPASQLRNSRSGRVFCCRSCKDTAQKLSGIKDIHPTHYGSRKGRAPKAQLLNSFPQRVCMGCAEIRPYLLTVHHIDGNGTNCEPDNLELLCYNCHAIRHLKLVDGQWQYHTSSLTPRDRIPDL